MLDAFNVIIGVLFFLEGSRNFMSQKIESIESFITHLKIIKAAIPSDLSIAVCDMEKFIGYYPGKNLNLHIRPGQPLHKEEPLMVALKTNRRLEATVPADFYGFEFVGTATPLHDQQGKVIGGIAVQVRKQSELIHISKTIMSSLIQATDQIQQIAEQSSSLKGAASDLLLQSKQAQQNVEETAQIVTFMKRMADQTNLLGLNAAIEAARAGEKGKGFGVVATEIRKFSKESADSSQQIRETMQQIHSATEKMADSITQVSAIGHEQTELVNQVSDFVKTIQQMSTQLNDYANKL